MPFSDPDPTYTLITDSIGCVKHFLKDFLVTSLSSQKTPDHPILTLVEMEVH